MLTVFAEHFNYAVVIVLMMIGLYVVIASGNLIKRLVGLSVFQTSVFLLYITTSKVFGAVPPILEDYKAEGEYDPSAAAGAASGAAETLYANPLPHVLILTAIVVGVATLAVGLALVVRIREAYGTIEDVALSRAEFSQELERGV